MVAESLVLVDRCGCGSSGDRRGRQLVVEAPSDVLGPSLPAIRPPGVAFFGRLRVKVAIRVDPARILKNLGDPGAFFRKKAGIFSIGFPVFQIDFALSDIPVCTDDNLTSALSQLDQMWIKDVEKTELGLLSLWRA